MLYKLRSHRREDGGYDLSFGRGAGKLEATVMRGSEGSKLWHIIGSGPAMDANPSVNELKRKWGEWAEKNYGQTVDSDKKVTAATSVPPPPPVRFQSKPGPPPPPTFKKKAGPVGQWGLWTNLSDWWLSDSPYRVEDIVVFPSQIAALKWLKEELPGVKHFEARLITEESLKQVPSISEKNEFICDPLDPAFVDKATGHITPLGALDEVFNWMQTRDHVMQEYPWKSVYATLQRQFPDRKKYQPGVK